MKTIAVTIPFASTARNLLRNDFYRILTERAKVVIFSPFSEQEAFRKEFGHPNVTFESMRYHSSLAGKIVRRILEPTETWLFTHETRIETLLILKDWLKKENPCRYWMTRFIAAAFGWSPLFSLLRRAGLECLKSPRYMEILRRHQVNLVFVSRIHGLADQQVAVTAQALGIAVIGMPHSWDNPTSKSGIRQGNGPEPGLLIPLRFDKMVVWSEILKREMMDFYGYQERDIFISGIPQFDFYPKRDLFMNRRDFFKRIGADPEKKLIAYMAGSPRYNPFQDEIIEILAKIVRGGTLGHPAQLLIRTHPNKTEDPRVVKMEKLYQGAADIFFTRPASSYKILEDVEWDSQKGDELDLPNTLLNADVVVTTGSTITMDAAALDRPTVNLDFDGYRNASNFNSVRTNNRYTHFRKAAATGGFKTAENPQEAEEGIKEYLADPARDRDKRSVLTVMECHRVDGSSGKRIAEFLLSMES